MTTTQKINTLWESLRDSIDASYKAGADSSLQKQVLWDYVRDMSMHDDLAELLDAETANERKHRWNRPAPKGFSADIAAKLILMTAVVDGSELHDCPPATDFLLYHKTAVEARVLGWLISKHINPELCLGVREFDYAKLMQGGA
jgi:hypothetical protein